jgi:Zn-dependent peptidase ImmA (M78 family)
MFGERLKLARKKAGLSLRALSDALDNQVSAQAIGKYERGDMMPGSRVLMNLAKTLDVAPEYLLSNQVLELTGMEFRKQSGTSARDRAKVEAAVIDHLERYLAVEKILEQSSAEWRVPKLKRRFLGSVEEADDLAMELRRTWSLGIDAIPNMTELMEEQGIKVILTELPEGVSGLTCVVRQSDGQDNMPVVVVNVSHSLERRRLTLAHELGHRIIDDDSPVDHEKAANAFAGAFLIPKAHLVQETGSCRNALGYQELVQLKRQYRVSAAALLVRLKKVGIIDEQTLSYAFQTYAKGWRHKEPEPIESEEKRGEFEKPQRFDRLCYWALAERYISPSKAMELLKQPMECIEQAMKGPVAVDANHCQ